MLEVCLGETEIAASAQAAAADGLGVRALDPGAGGVAQPERLGFRLLARALQRLEVLARRPPDEAWLALAAGAARAQRAWEAVPAREARFKAHPALRVGARQPGDALLACRAGHYLAVPVHSEFGLGQSVVQARLPARVIGDRADDGHAVALLAAHQHVRVCVALVHQVLARQQTALLQ